jgi:hypothetical protein
LARFIALARAEIGEDASSCGLAEAVDLLERIAERLTAMQGSARDAEAGAGAFLDLCGSVAQGWMALRIMHLAGDDQVGLRMQAAARFYLAELPVRAQAQAGLATLGAARLNGFEACLG